MRGLRQPRSRLRMKRNDLPALAAELVGGGHPRRLLDADGSRWPLLPALPLMKSGAGGHGAGAGLPPDAGGPTLPAPNRQHMGVFDTGVMSDVLGGMRSGHTRPDGASEQGPPMVEPAGPHQEQRLPLRQTSRRATRSVLTSALLHVGLLAGALALSGPRLELERGGEAVIPVELLIVGPAEQDQSDAASLAEGLAMAAQVASASGADITSPMPALPEAAPPAAVMPEPDTAQLESPSVPVEPQIAMPIELPPPLALDPMEVLLQAAPQPVQPEPPIVASMTALPPQPPQPAQPNPPVPPVAKLTTPEPRKMRPPVPRAAPKAQAPAPHRAEQAQAAAAPRGPEASVARPASQRGGTGGSGAQAGTARVSSWRAQVLAHLARHKTYPAEARDDGIEGRTTVAFTLTRTGQVTALALAGSSGSRLLDQATLAMVRRAAPYPAMPEGGPASMNFTAAIRYDLR